MKFEKSRAIGWSSVGDLVGNKVRVEPRLWSSRCGKKMQMWKRERKRAYTKRKIVIL